MFCLGVSSAAVFAEPTVPKVEEVVGLVHGRKTEVRIQKKEARSGT
jgi:hypothetical protein